MIPEAAVEAAKAAIWEFRGSPIEFEWQRNIIVRKILEAAAPHMLAGVTALADAWEARGEHDMAFSKTIPDEDIAMEILTSGAQMVESARHIRNAIGATK